jgi:beta-lactam-binding protein with PASTA domain
VPPTRNDSVGTADQILTAAGFTVSGVQGNPLNTVKGTNPPAGKQVLYGSSVEILTK